MTISSINTTTFYSTNTLSESRTLPPPPPEGAPPAGGLAEDVFAVLEELGLVSAENEASTDTAATGEAMGQFMFTLFEAMRMQGADTGYGDPLADMDSLIAALDSESAGFGELSASYESLVSTLGASSSDAASLQEFLETLRSQMSERGFPGLSGSVVETTA